MRESRCRSVAGSIFELIYMDRFVHEKRFLGSLSCGRFLGALFQDILIVLVEFAEMKKASGMRDWR